MSSCVGVYVHNIHIRAHLLVLGWFVDLCRLESSMSEMVGRTSGSGEIRVVLVQGKLGGLG